MKKTFEKPLFEVKEMIKTNICAGSMEVQLMDDFTINQY